MNALTNAIHFLNAYGFSQPAWGLQYILMNVQAFLLGQMKVVS